MLAIVRKVCREVEVSFLDQLHDRLQLVFAGARNTNGFSLNLWLRLWVLVSDHFRDLFSLVLVEPALEWDVPTHDHTRLLWLLRGI